MINAFETTARTHPDRVFFSFVDAQGNKTAYTYRKTRLLAANMAQRLRRRGVRPGDCVSVDLPNCPEYVFLALAAAYGSFSLVTLNHHLSSADKLMRIMELERYGNVRVAFRADEIEAAHLLELAQAELSGLEVSDGTRARTRTSRSFAQRQHVIMGAQQDAEEEAIHFAERAAHLFDSGTRALIMFTSGTGTQGIMKAVPLTWAQLTGAARAANESFASRGAGLWQAALPLHHIRGFQVVVRSVCNGTPFVLYRGFDATRTLRDAVRTRATHLAVTDAMLQELLSAENASALSAYRCVLLGGGPPNPATLRRAIAARVRLYVSYGMTETSSHLAQTLAGTAFDGGLRLLPGYAARIVDEGPDGYGRLAVRGPGVFSGYLNARAALTVDGFFLTNNVAALHEGRIYLKERTDDVFGSGGENVYPAEVVEELLKVPGVRAACVVGVKDQKCGYRPVAFIERDETMFPGVTAHQYAEQVKGWLMGTLPRTHRPSHIAVMRALPRKPDGTPDSAALLRLIEGSS